MKIDLNVNVFVGDTQVDKINVGGVTVWQRITNTAPLIESFTGTKTDETTVTLSYTVDNGGSPLTSLDYRLNNGAWTPAPSLALTGSIELTELEIGEVAEFELRAVNEIGETISQTLSFLISGEFVAFLEDFSDAGKLPDDAWRDDNNGNPIAGEPVNVRVKEGGGFDSKMVQIKYLAWDLGQGNYPGTRRLEHPFSYFNVPMNKAYEYSVDWYFEDIWDFNTIGQDAATLKQRLMDHDGLSEATADAQVTEWNPNPLYADTGFPYQVGKMHGLVSSHEGATPAGSQPKDPKEWSVRCSWVKNTQSHPATDGNGLFTDGADPDVGPTIALYIYDQDREQNPDGSWPPGRYVFVDDFGGLQKETWYTIKLFVQVNDKGKRNGIAWLRLYDRDTDTLLASAYVDNLLLHDADTIGEAYVRRFMFSTFFGGGDMRFSPKLNPAWDSLVDVNSGLYARNDNYEVNRIPALAPPVLSQTYNAGSADVEVTHNLGISLFDDIEYNITAAGAEYDPANWTAPASYTVTDEVASFTINSVNDGDDIRVRVVNGERRSPRSDGSSVVVPTVPDAPSIDSISELINELQVNFTPPANDGDSIITKYEYRVDGGTVVQAGSFSGNQFTIASFSLDGLTAGQTYQIEMRAVNAIGNSAWTAIATGTPVSAYTFPIPTTGLRRLYDPVDLGLADGNTVSQWITPAVQTGTFAYEADAPAGQEPTYKANGINGQPSVVFNGVDQVLNEVDPIPFGLSADEASFYVVSKAHTSHAGSVLSTLPDDPSNRINLHIPYLYNGVDYLGFDYGDRNNGGRVLQDWQSSFNTWYLWEFRVKPGLMEVYRNGDLITSSLSNSATPVDFISGERFQIGRFLTNEYFNGEIAFIGMYNRFVDGQDRIDILNYVQTRFGLTMTVPVIGAPTVTINAPSAGETELTFSYEISINGSDLTLLRYRVDSGQWVDLPLDPIGRFTVSGLITDQQYTVDVEAANEFGTGTDTQTGTPVANTPAPVITSITAIEEGAEVHWEYIPSKAVIDSIIPNDGFLTVSASVGDGGSPITAWYYQVNNGPWRNGNSIAGDFTIPNLTNGVEVSVRVKAENNVGMGNASDSVLGTPAIPVHPEATGGDSVYDIDVNGTPYRVHEFTNDGTLNVTTGGEFEYLVIAGGASGGRSRGGGGGAGGFKEASAILTAQSISITIGAGGVGNSVSGGDTVFGNVFTAIGGGLGSSGDGNNGGDGGSGGGAGIKTDPGIGTSGQGFNGGNEYRGSIDCGGGGGGAGEAGGNASSNGAGDGGNGKQSSITGIAKYYAGGGGGGVMPTGATEGSGGLGGGGNGGSGGDGQDASYYGSAGGGGGRSKQVDGYNGNGGNGYQGIVIVRYKLV
jgi:hypothetical protein